MLVIAQSSGESGQEPQKRTGLFRPLIVALLIGILVCAAYLSAEIYKRQIVLQQTAHYNIVWAATRLSADLNRFGQTLAESAIPGAQLDKTQLLLRADIVKNRVNVMTNGEFYEFT